MTLQHPSKGEENSGLDPFYPIVDSAEWVARLVRVGAKFIQLRIKDKDELAVVARDPHGARRPAGPWARALSSTTTGGSRSTRALPWLHLGQGDLDDADMLAMRKAGIKLGISTHDDAELVRALTFAPDYIALGPIYPTKLKAMAFAPQGPEKIGVWKRRIGAMPLVAIGGLNVERAKLCLAAGADIVSVVTDITLNADPEARAREWVAATRQT